MRDSGGRAVSLAILFLAAVSATAADPPSRAAFDPGAVPWTRLEFEAKKLWATGTTEVRLGSAEGGDLDRQLIASPRGTALRPGVPRLTVLAMNAAFAGRRSETSVWFDPQRSTAFQRLKRRIGKKGYQKTYRYGEDGVYVLRRAPLDARQGEGPVDGWGKIEEFFYPYPQERPDCVTVSDPSLLLYLVAAAGPGDPFSVCTFSGKTLFLVEFKPRGTTSLAVDYVTRSQGQESRRQGDVEAACVVLEARPVEAVEGEDFEFLGLEGDVEIFLDGRIPVAVEGRLPGLGKLRIQLAAADLLASAP